MGQEGEAEGSGNEAALAVDAVLCNVSPNVY